MPLEAEAVNSASCITRRSPIAGRPDQAEFFNAICAFPPAGIDVKRTLRDRCNQKVRARTVLCLESRPTLFRNHDGWSVDVAGRRERHNGGVDDPDAEESTHF